MPGTILSLFHGLSFEVLSITASSFLSREVRSSSNFRQDFNCLVLPKKWTTVFWFHIHLKQNFGIICCSFLQLGQSYYILLGKLSVLSFHSWKAPWLQRHSTWVVNNINSKAATTSQPTMAYHFMVHTTTHHTTDHPMAHHIVNCTTAHHNMNHTQVNTQSS